MDRKDHPIRRRDLRFRLGSHFFGIVAAVVVVAVVVVVEVVAAVDPAAVEIPAPAALAVAMPSPQMDH